VPIVFSPGEPETRPLDPTATVYTTAQKVADLLDIGPGEAVLVSADSVSDGVYITGADYRNVGYSVGDILLIYSDADPLGVEKTITAITSSASGVKLAFTGSFTHADYQFADNAYVQNQASFTNGRTRGLTKDKVDNVILKMQDKIDNLTRNAWRPYLVSAEYINFDTYKPYRRRYYTDYVGTAPLLFRNIQQILRLELWQGDDYREIGAAEARIKITDANTLTGKSIVMGAGNGTHATLTVGETSTTWRAAFDIATTAQNLADLINKEDRVSKTALDFSPAFTLEGSTSNVAVHNEFLATANADYGTGVVKITSMRGVKGGETCSIVATSTDIDISQTTLNTTTSASVSSTTVTVTDASSFLEKGVCLVGTEVFAYTGKTGTTFTGCTNVIGTPLTTMASSTHEVTQNEFVVDLQGGSSSGDSGRLRDWWIDYEMGIVYFNNSYPFFEWNAIKTSYIYGERYLEKAIEDVCTKMVAIELLMADDRSVLIPEGTQNIDLASKVQLYQMDVDRTLPKYVEMVVFE